MCFVCLNAVFQKIMLLFLSVRHLDNQQQVTFTDVLVSWKPSTQAVDLFEEHRESCIFVALAFGFIFTHFKSFRNSGALHVKSYQTEV